MKSIDIFDSVAFLVYYRAPRDQGLTRPKVLILVPFREAALRTVNVLINLLVPHGQVGSIPSLHSS